MACLLMVGAVSAYRSGLIGELPGLSNRLLATRSKHDDARATANLLRNDAECAKYRAAILAEEGKHTEHAAFAIEQAYEEGKAANCLKLDLE